MIVSNQMASTDMDFSWKEFFREPLLQTNTCKIQRRCYHTSNVLGVEALSTYKKTSFKYDLTGCWADYGESRPQRNRFKNNSNTAILESTDVKPRQNVINGNNVEINVPRRKFIRNESALSGSLITMYAKRGDLAKAQEVFDEIPIRSVLSWNAIISAYAHEGHGEKAYKLFTQMKDDGCSPDATTFASVLKACSNLSLVKKGEEVHEEIVKEGLLKRNVMLANSLVNMYAKCGMLEKAQLVFDEIQMRNVVSWNILVSGYTQNGLYHKALDCFRQMNNEGLSPNAFTFVSILKACGNTGSATMGEEIHAEACEQGLFGKNIIVGNALVDMYAKCGLLQKAKEVFDLLPEKNVITWNSLIAGYAQHGLGIEAVHCFTQMQNENVCPDVTTFSCVLKACSSIGLVEKGEQVHNEVRKQGLFPKSLIIGTALVDMYAKCGKVEKAQEIFDELLVRDVISWTALIAGYVHHGHANEALQSFVKMQGEGISPNSVTFACILKACGIIGSAEIGEEIHIKIQKQGLLRKDIVLANALIDMYVKCGELEKAQEVFDELPRRDAICWTALIAGYSQLGQVENAFALFSKMIAEGYFPDAITFIFLLTACSHAGLMEEGLICFETLKTVYCVTPTLEHYTCLIDIFSRAGHLHKAVALLEKVQPSDSHVLYLALLGACRKWVNLEIGRWAFEHSVQADENNPFPYVCMSDIFAAAGMQVDADSIEALRIQRGAWKVF